MRIKAVVETAIYVDDLQATETFYQTILGLRVGVDVRVQFAGEPAVGLLDVVGARVPADSEDPVVVVHG